MAGTKPIRSSRGRYTIAGNNARAILLGREDEEQQDNRRLYIADVPAGSRQDELRDLNRAGYRVERPWRENGAKQEDIPPHTEENWNRQTSNRPQSRETFVERMISQAKREKRDAGICAALFLAFLLLLATSGQKAMEMNGIRQNIERVNQEIVQLDQESESLAQQLALAKQDDRIRNLAQNQLNMLRPERAEVQTIYIQAGDRGREQTQQQTQEPRMEMLDVLLGLLDVFQIGE